MSEDQEVIVAESEIVATENLPSVPAHQEMANWDGAAQRGLKARNERLEIIKTVLKKGKHFGLVPGSKKDTLLKAGAEVISDCLNLCPNYERVTVLEDWDKPLFHYAYRCLLIVRGSDVVVATGIGSCNSMEPKYRWRQAKLHCPACGTEAVIRGKEEYGGGWLCWKKHKNGGCGTKFDIDDEGITKQDTDRVLNEDIHGLVNTFDKMAQKRALVAANLNLGFSDHFTQDMEDGVQPDQGDNTRPAQQMPQERSETTDTGAYEEGQPIPEGPQTFKGYLTGTEMKTGGEEDSKYTLWIITPDQGKNFGCYSEAVAKRAELAAEGGVKVEITYQYTKKGNRQIIGIEDA